MTKGAALRDRTAAAIIDGAAVAMAARGDAVSMNDVAEAAGVSRATLYRHFPDREALLDAMAKNGIADLAERIADADLDRVPIDQGIARLVRAFLTTGGKYRALLRTGFGRTDEQPDVDVLLADPVRTLFRRGIGEGSLRSDLDVDLLVDLFSGLIRAALESTASGHAGAEATATAVTAIFLTGAQA